MVNKLKKILSQIENKHAKVAMLALIKMDELTNKWSVILSAAWIKEENRNVIFRELVEAINNELTPQESITIARIGLFPQNEHIIQELLQYKEGSHIEEKVQMNGNIIHEAYILASNSTKQNKQ